MNAVADKLREARALVERGWTQGVHVRRANGVPTYVEDSKAVYWCAAGALYRAGAYASCLRFLERAARTRRALSVWNDAKSRTQEQVLAVFDKAIALAEAGK